jgi:hypothetical protein
MKSGEPDVTSGSEGANGAARPKRKARNSLSHELLGMEPEEFAAEVRAFREASALSPDMRERLRRRLVEHLKAPIDAPSWGPDWLNWHALEEAERRGSGPAPEGVSSDEMDSRVIVRNLERSRHVARYMPLYLATAILSVLVAVLAMFVDYQIISGDIWTRALADEFMVVPDSLKGSVMFKSLQVVFAVLAIHFMLKITGVYGRNALISTAFTLTVLMVACLGYLVAYNNMPGGTAAVARIGAVRRRAGEHDRCPVRVAGRTRRPGRRFGRTRTAATGIRCGVSRSLASLSAHFAGSARQYR